MTRGVCARGFTDTGHTGPLGPARPVGPEAPCWSPGPGETPSGSRPAVGPRGWAPGSCHLSGLGAGGTGRGGLKAAGGARAHPLLGSRRPFQSLVSAGTPGRPASPARLPGPWRQPAPCNLPCCPLSFSSRMPMWALVEQTRMPAGAREVQEAGTPRVSGWGRGR